MRRSAALAIALGAIAGATVRWAAVEVWPPRDGFPWTIFVVNVVGSFVVGIALAEEAAHPTWELIARYAVGIGFCGGLTTFSTFAVETATMLDDGRTGLAAAYMGASVFASITAGSSTLERRARSCGGIVRSAP